MTARNKISLLLPVLCAIASLAACSAIQPERSIGRELDLAGDQIGDVAQ